MSILSTLKKMTGKPGATTISQALPDSLGISGHRIEINIVPIESVDQDILDIFGHYFGGDAGSVAIAARLSISPSEFLSAVKANAPLWLSAGTLEDDIDFSMRLITVIEHSSRIPNMWYLGGQNEPLVPVYVADDYIYMAFIRQ